MLIYKDWAGFTGYYIPDNLWNMPVGKERDDAIDNYLFDVEVGNRNDFEVKVDAKVWPTILIATPESVSIKDQIKYRNEMIMAYASIALADRQRRKSGWEILQEEDDLWT